MYFFYFDESGSRDPSAGTAEKPKDHLYVLLAVGMYEGQWRPFETEISGRKLELADRLSRQGKGRFELADCEVKSNWVRIPGEREKRSRFLHGLTAADLTRLTDAYFDQVAARHTVIMASVVDKRFLHEGTTHETLHMTAYEFVLERIQHYMRQYHPKHRALIVMDDTSRQLSPSRCLTSDRSALALSALSDIPASSASASANSRSTAFLSSACAASNAGDCRSGGLSRS